MAISKPLIASRAGPASLSRCQKLSKPSFERFLVRSSQSVPLLPQKRLSLNPCGVNWSSSFSAPFKLPQKCLHKRTTRVCAKQAGQYSPEEARKDHDPVHKPSSAPQLTRRSACIGLNSAILDACLGPLDHSDASTKTNVDSDQFLGQHSGGSELGEGEEALSRRIDGRHVVITGGNSGKISESVAGRELQGESHLSNAPFPKSWWLSKVWGSLNALFIEAIKQLRRSMIVSHSSLPQKRTRTGSLSSLH